MEQLLNGDFRKLEKLDRVSSSEPVHLKVELFGCDNCKDTAGFMVSLVTVEVDKDGKESEKCDNISELFILPYYELEKLKALGERPVTDKKDESGGK